MSRRGAHEANLESQARAQTDDTRETKDRLRRIETRLVKLFEHLGFDTERKKPEYVIANGNVIIHSMETSIKDIVEVVPKDAGRSITIRHKGEIVAIMVT